MKLECLAQFQSIRDARGTEGSNSLIRASLTLGQVVAFIPKTRQLCFMASNGSKVRYGGYDSLCQCRQPTPSKRKAENQHDSTPQKCAACSFAVAADSLRDANHEKKDQTNAVAENHEQPCVGGNFFFKAEVASVPLIFSW